MILGLLVSFFLLLLPLPDSYYSKFLTPSSNENFIHCFKNNTNPNDDLSYIIYATTNSAYTSILQAYIKNLRFIKTSETRKPEFVVTPSKKSHVSAAVICTKNTGLSLRIRSGGHDFEGLSYTSDVPFVILDMFNLREISVSIDRQVAYVEAGATLGELYYKIWEKSGVHGFPAGVCPTVGIGGHISGGGYGNMLRKHGLSVDQVVDAELVDVRGRILDKNSMGKDLFWAIKGGGGASFGVVLSYTLNLVSVPKTVTVFQVMRFAEDNVTALVYKWQHIMEDIDKNLFIRLILQPIKPKHNGLTEVRVTFMSLFLGSAEKLLSLMNSELPELGLQKSDCMEMSWAQSVLFWANYDHVTTEIKVLQNRTYNATYLKRKSDYVTKPIPEKDLELLWKKLIELEEPGLVFNPYGGRMKEISDTETPFPHRDGNLYKIQYSLSWSEADEDAEDKYLKLIRELYDFMTPYVSDSPRSAYLNYRDLDIGVNNHNYTYEESKIFGEKYFKGNFEKLVKIKSKVDANNFFRNEQSIPAVKSSGKKPRIGYVVYFINAFASWLACVKWFG